MTSARAPSRCAKGNSVMSSQSVSVGEVIPKRKTVAVPAMDVEQTPDFQSDGVFDIELYRSLLAQNGYTPAEFERAQLVSLRRNQMQRAIVGSAVMSPAPSSSMTLKKFATPARPSGSCALPP